MNTAIHEIAPEEIMAHHDGELSAERERAQLVSAHLETCAECSEQLESLRATARLAATWKIDSTPSSLTLELLRASIRNRAHDSIDFAVFWERLHNRRMAVALGLAVAAIAFLFVEIEAPKSAHSHSEQAYVTPLDIGDYVTKLPAGVSKAGGGGGGGDRSIAPQVMRNMSEEDDATTTARTPMIARTVELKIVVKKFDDARSDGAIHSAASPRLCGNFKHQ